MRKSNQEGKLAELSPARLRCAIYTRKSTEEGLEQEFNSLDAQREAAEAFIQSQRREGWIALPDLYDDGGFTGANMVLSRHDIPNGVIPVMLILFGLPLIGFCLVAGAALIGESEGWTIDCLQFVVRTGLVLHYS